MKLSLWQGMSVASLILGFFNPWCLIGLVAFVAADVLGQLSTQRDKGLDESAKLKAQEDIDKLRNEFRSLESKVGMSLGRKLP